MTTIVRRRLSRHSHAKIIPLLAEILGISHDEADGSIKKFDEENGAR